MMAGNEGDGQQGLPSNATSCATSMNPSDTTVASSPLEAGELTEVTNGDSSSTVPTDVPSSTVQTDSPSALQNDVSSVLKIDFPSAVENETNCIAHTAEVNGAQMQGDSSSKTEAAEEPCGQTPSEKDPQSGSIPYHSLEYSKKSTAKSFSRGDKPALLFRPYRGLVFYEEELKRWFKRRERRWGQPAKDERGADGPRQQ